MSKQVSQIKFLNTLRSKVGDGVVIYADCDLCGLRITLEAGKLHSLPIFIEHKSITVSTANTIADAANEMLIDTKRYTITRFISTLLVKVKRSLLKLFYIDNISLKEIAVTLNYKSAESVKVQKHRCLKQLKENVFKKLGDT